MSRRSFDGTPPAGAGAFFDGPQLPPAFREGDGIEPRRRAPNRRQLLVVAALTLVALALMWPGTPRSLGSGFMIGRDRHWGNRLPLLYGSAWKEDQTAMNVVDAVLAGFRGVDTACQPQHYREDLVGEALRTLKNEHGIGREAVWLQTKFTPAQHQGADMPYDPAAPLSDQVAQSLQVSLKNLQVTSVDALLLHGPLETHERTMEAWRAMERQVELGFVTQLGISNLHDVRRFERIYEEAAVKPRVLQNRFSPQLGHDAEIRLFCQRHGIIYQPFWVLSANGQQLKSPAVTAAALAHRVEPEQVLFSYLRQQGAQPLSGTTSTVYMQDNLASSDFAPTRAEMRELDELFLRPRGEYAAPRGRITTWRGPRGAYDAAPRRRITTWRGPR